MNIITGFRGEAHITSQQDQAQNQGTFGQGSYILNQGENLRAEAASASEIRIYDGALSHQGVVAVVEKNTYDSLDITSGSQGVERIDLIVARYTKANDTGIESVTLEVITGTEADSDPSVPSYNTGDIQAGDSPVDMPLYEVHLSGITIESINRVAEMASPLSTGFYQRGILAPGNLNDAIEFGTYGLLSTNTYTNLPTGVTSVNGNLNVFLDGDSGFITQLLSVGETTRQRFFNGSSWSAWKAMSVSSAYFNTFDELLAYANALGSGNTFIFSCAMACANSIAGDTSLSNSFGVAYNQPTGLSIFLQTSAGHRVYSALYNKESNTFSYRYPVYMRTTETHTYNGLTITAERMGGFVRVKAAGTLTAAINTQSSNITIATLSTPFRPVLAVSERKIVANTHIANVIVNTNGTMQVGYSYTLSGTTATAAAIPSGQQVRFEAAYISIGNLV